MKKLRAVLRWTWRILLVLFVLLTVFILEENIRGRIMLARYKAELRAKGEKLTLAEFDLPKVPKEGNGAAALLEAADELAPRSKTNALWLSGLWVMKFFTPGRAHVLYREREPANRTPPYTWDDLSRDIAAVSNILERARTAAQRPTLAVELDYSRDLRQQSLHSMDVRYLRNWLAAAALDALHREDLNAALNNIAAMVRLTQVQKNERLVDAQTSRLRTGAYSLKITWEALQADGWTDRQLAKLQEYWQEAECLTDLVPSMEMDRVTSLQYYHRDTLKDLRDSLEWVSYYSDELRQGFDYRLDTFLLTAHWLLWRAAWFEQDQLRALRRWSENLDGARAVAKQKSWTAWSCARERPWTLCDRWRYLVSGGSYSGEFETGRAVRYETLREMAIAAIALKRFHLRTGTFPASLSALVPEFLPELPCDWMDGKPLHYRLNANGAFTLYSVGENGVDDGGQPDPSPVSWFLDVWDAPDEVWPVAVTQEEIEAQELKWATRGKVRAKGPK